MRTDYDLDSVPDDRLLADLSSLVATDCRTQAKLLAHIGEVEERRLYCARGYSSMHGYCTGELHLSEAAAYKRITAARAARRVPAIYDAVATGRVHVSGLTVLAPLLTADNGAALLARATHKTKRQIEQLVAELAPKPDVAPSVRKLPAPTAKTPPLVRAPTAGAGATSAEAPSVARAPAPPPPVLQPLAPSRFKVQLTIGDRTHDRLRRVQALLRHQVPDGDLETIFDRALETLEQQLMKRKFAVTDKPRSAVDQIAPTPGSRHLPAALKRAVVERVGLQCTWTSADGRRCEERGALEFHHIVPHGKGGPPTVDNITLLCRAHNQYQGVVDYGAWAMRPRAGRAREPRAAYGRRSPAAMGGRSAVSATGFAPGRRRCDQS